MSDLGAKVEVYRNDKITSQEIINNIKPQSIVLSPGPKTPDDAGICLELIKQNKSIPLLGICLGHQSIGQSYGGNIIASKEIMHGKIDKIIHFNNLIFKGIKSEFEATRYHSLIIEEKTLPTQLEIIAKTRDGTIMGVADKKNKVFGLQFHPESIGTLEGKKILKNFLDITNYEY